MIDISLTGLRADTPIGAMAAFGCLRTCERSPEFRGAKLGWASAGGSFTAMLRIASNQRKEQLLEFLKRDAAQAPERFEFTWREKLKSLSEHEFRAAAGRALETADSDSRETADWFSAFGTDVLVDDEGNVETTPLDMTGGPQKLLSGVVELAATLCDSEGAFEEALFGPWKYNDDQHSLGWDPATIKLGAFTYKAPTKMANSGVMGAIWLAFQSISLFPCFAVKNHLEATSFERIRRQYTFEWPVWSEPIGLDELRLLLGMSYKDPTTLNGRGIQAAYRTRRFYLNKYYAAFRPPELVYGGVVAANA